MFVRFPCRADRVVAPAGALGSEEVSRREYFPRERDLLAEPGVEALRQAVVVEPGPGGGVNRVELARVSRLEERLAERAADAHRLSDRLHLRPERAIRSRELLEGEARKFHNDVVESRLEARGRRLRQVVRDLGERVADRELGSDLRDRVARRLRGERGGARDA